MRRLFRCIAVKYATNAGWILKISDGSQNHPPHLPDALVVHRRAAMNTELVKDIISQTNQGTKPSEISTGIRNWAEETKQEHFAVTLQDIWNVKRKLRRDELGIRTVTQAVLRKLKGSEWISSHQ